MKVLVLALLTVAVCYEFVDRAVARFVFEHGREPGLKWLTYPPPIVQTWTPALLTLIGLRWMAGRPTRLERVVFTAGVCLVIADQFRESLALVFGRTWPETWIDDNPSYIQNGVYGFHFFHGGRGYESFPSGHTARTAAAAAVFWIAYPAWWVRCLCAAATTLVAIGLIGMNYHFVSDVVAGGLVGGIVGAFGARVMTHEGPSTNA